MNYRDFFKNKKATVKDIQNLIPEGVDLKEFKKGMVVERQYTNNNFSAAKLVSQNLKEDAIYYSKICENYEEEDESTTLKPDPNEKDLGPNRKSPTDLDVQSQKVDKMFGKMEKDPSYRPHPFGKKDDVEECGEENVGNEYGSEYDDNGGLPLDGGALAIPHLGDPIKLGKIIQVGKDFGKGASGELSGMTNVSKGVNKDKGGIPATQPSDKEHLTAGGKPVDSSIASKSVGGAVVGGQVQGGPHIQGTIASTSKLDESKSKVRNIVKEVLKEIRFDKKSGKWVKLNEGHKSGCECAFCKNKGSFGKKSKKEDKKEMDEGDVSNQPNDNSEFNYGAQYSVRDGSYQGEQPGKLMRARQFQGNPRVTEGDPEITEMYDDEEECMMNERYVELANANRNLNESELSELRTLREKIDHINNLRKNYGASHGGVEPSLYDENEEDNYERQNYQRGIDKHNRQNRQRFECPTCKTPNALSSWEKSKGYQCNSCANAEEGPLGGGYSEYGNEYEEGTADEGSDKWIQKAVKPSHKGYCTPMTKPTCTPHRKALAKRFKSGDLSEDSVSKDPNHELSNWGAQYSVRDGATQAEQPGQVMRARQIQKSPRVNEDDVNEAGGQSVQHRSFRTVKDFPQNPDARWSDEVYEGKKPSDVSKTIQKGMKTKKTKKNPFLKFQKSKKTSSGVHKRKT